MRLPIEPLSALEKLPTTETDVRQTEPVTAARAIATGLPPLYTPRSLARSTGAPVQADIEPATEYAGQERRQGERRVESKAPMLDTRVRRDRRARSQRPSVDLKV
jgi:hypothetical protein